MKEHEESKYIVLWKKATWKGHKMFDSRFQLYDIQEKAKLGDSERPLIAREGDTERWASGEQSILEQWDLSVWYYNSGYMSLGTYPNSWMYAHKVSPNMNSGLWVIIIHWCRFITANKFPGVECWWWGLCVYEDKGDSNPVLSGPFCWS